MRDAPTAHGWKVPEPGCTPTHTGGLRGHCSYGECGEMLADPDCPFFLMLWSYRSQSMACPKSRTNEALWWPGGTPQGHASPSPVHGMRARGAPGGKGPTFGPRV